MNYQSLKLLSSNCPTRQNSTFLFFIAFIAFLYFYLVCVCVGVGDAMVWMWSETDFLESFLSFHWTQNTRLTASPLTCWALSLAWRVQARFSKANKSPCCKAWPSICSWLCWFVIITGLLSVSLGLQNFLYFLYQLSKREKRAFFPNLPQSVTASHPGFSLGWT